MKTAAATDARQLLPTPTLREGVSHGSHRTTIALPRALFDEALKLGRDEGHVSLNAVVQAALEEYAERRRREAFAASITIMSRDPEVVGESDQMNALFATTDSDGLR